MLQELRFLPQELQRKSQGLGNMCLLQQQYSRNMLKWILSELMLFFEGAASLNAELEAKRRTAIVRQIKVEDLFISLDKILLINWIFFDNKVN